MAALSASVTLLITPHLSEGIMKPHLNRVTDSAIEPAIGA